MRRLLALTLIASLASASTVFAGESLVQSAARIVKEAAQTTDEAANKGSARSITASQSATWTKRMTPSAEALLQGQGPALAKSGLRKRTKVMIYTGAAIGFVSAAYAIDHNVLNVTPSSLGTRKD